MEELEKELDLLNQEFRKLQQNEPEDLSYTEYCQYYSSINKRLLKNDSAMRMIMIPEYSELSKFGDVMSLNNFIKICKSGGFVDSDGNGLYIKDGMQSNIRIHPSDVTNDRIRKDFNQIIWFNK